MLSGAFTRCRCRDMDFNAVVTATGREKTTAALVSTSLIAIHVNAKTVSLFLMHPFFLTGFYQLSVAQFPAGDFRVPCRTLIRFLFFFTCSVVVFRVIVREYLLNHPLLLLLCLVRQTEDATKRVACTTCCGVGQAQQYCNSSYG